MNNYFYLLFSFLFLISLNTKGQTTLIYFESEWKYYDAGNEPTLQSGQQWYQTNFSDSQWDSGEGQLGYGDNDEETELDDDAKTIYLRKEINVSEASDYASLQIDLIYDDGAVVYINGSEVKRVNMPSGSVDYTTFSVADLGDDKEASFPTDNLLVDGVNVIAVEMHQRNSASSDLSFDLELKGIEGVSGGGSGGGNSGGSGGGTTSTEEIIRGPYLQKATRTQPIITTFLMATPRM